MADVPGGASGLLVRDYKGREAARLVTRIDPGVVSLVAELRQVIIERAASPDFADVPGGTTGLLVKAYKGKDADQPVYRADRPPRRTAPPATGQAVVPTLHEAGLPGEEAGRRGFPATLTGLESNRENAVVCSRVREPPMPWPPTGDRGWMA
jgi:hypothetical protein